MGEDYDKLSSSFKDAQRSYERQLPDFDEDEDMTDDDRYAPATMNALGFPNLDKYSGGFSEGKYSVYVDRKRFRAMITIVRVDSVNNVWETQEIQPQHALNDLSCVKELINEILTFSKEHKINLLFRADYMFEVYPEYSMLLLKMGFDSTGYTNLLGYFCQPRSTIIPIIEKMFERYSKRDNASVIISQSDDSGFTYVIQIFGRDRETDYIEFANPGDDGIALCNDLTVAKPFSDVTEAHKYAKSIGLKNNQYAIYGVFIV